MHDGNQTAFVALPRTFKTKCATNNNLLNKHIGAPGPPARSWGCKQYSNLETCISPPLLIRRKIEIGL
ncbi:unnamed protein product [Penicillium camemberti]|uniref:Str. FM013 n=1 Tax=Penicillium camemberti (strain FM 013) TaxID=1429867 RepID=A0A0G4P363_PENC3|nr:unnamed protein product [Penicillium camemberti]